MSHIEQIIQAGVLAPSGENCQPWRFVIRGDEIFLYNMPERDQSLYGAGQRTSYIAHGAAIENMILSAGVLGYRSDVSLFPDSTDKNLVARIRLEKGNVAADPLAGVIKDRSSNRKPYRAKPLKENDRASLIAAAGGNAHFLLEQETDKINALAEAASVNELILFENRALHDFFFSHINWTKEEDEQKSVGFYLKTLELPPPAVLGFKLFRKWSRQVVANRFGASKLVSAVNAKIYRSCSAIGCFSVPAGDAQKDYVMAGRAFERVWLAATARGISIQPLAGLVSLMIGIRSHETGSLTPEQIGLIESAYGDIKKIFNLSSGEIVMMFRVGDGGSPSARSSRLPPQIVVS